MRQPDNLPVLSAPLKEAEFWEGGLKPIVAGKGRKVRRCQGEVGLVKTALNLAEFIFKLFCSIEAATSYVRQASAKCYPKPLRDSNFSAILYFISKSVSCLSPVLCFFTNCINNNKRSAKDLVDFQVRKANLW